MGTEQSFDAIVVGARIAGATTAAHLARLGWHVALLEQKAGPLGMTLSVPICYPRALAQFQEHGFVSVLDDIKPRLAQIQTLHIRLDEHLLIQGKVPAYHGFDYASILRREVLDDALLQYVLSDTYPGAITYFSGHKVIRLVENGTQVIGVEAEEGRQFHRFSAPLTIGAGGRRSSVARLLHLQNQRERAGVITICYSYCRGIDWTGLPDVMFTPAGQHRMVVTSHVGEGMDVIGVFLPVTQYEDFSTLAQGQTLHDKLRATLCAAPELAGRLDHLEWIGAAMRFRPDQNIGYFRQAGGAGWALVGDATHFKDPASGQGLHDVFITVKYLMQAIGAMTRGKPLTRSEANSLRWLRTLEAAQQRRDHELLPMFEYTYQFGELLTRDPTRIERTLFQTIAESPRLTARFLGINSGATSVTRFNLLAPLYLAGHFLHLPQ